MYKNLLKKSRVKKTTAITNHKEHMRNITLLGDSIFDNRAYVKGGKAVIDHIYEQSGEDCRAALLAVDGSRVNDIHKQLKKVHKDTTHFVVSVGGNDALDEMGILEQECSIAADVFWELSDVGLDFEKRYAKMLKAVLKFDLPTTVCTIYYPRFEEPVMQKLACAALATFNDVIIKQAFMHDLPIIDLRLVCDKDADYANPIEPSEAGGLKIAREILKNCKVRSSF